MSNRAVFDRFFSDLDRLDIDAVVGAFTDDGYYHDLCLPTDPTVGKDAIRRKLQPLAACERIEFRFSVVVEDGDRILAERVEVWHLPSGAKLELPVMCVMEFRDGRIAGWREYWDMQTLTKQMPPDFLRSSAGGSSR